jgi:hypothetical protein
MLHTIPFASGKLLEKSSCFFDIEHEEGFSSQGIYVILSFLRQPIVESLGEYPIFQDGSCEICRGTMIVLPCLSKSLVRKLLEAHPRITSVTLLADLLDEKSRSHVEINLDINLGNEW